MPRADSGESRVVFEGNTDLGEENGGKYTWRGAIVGELFSGKYESSGGKQGTFEMKPAAGKERSRSSARVLSWPMQRRTQ
jgi:hypothetical protein